MSETFAYDNLIAGDFPRVTGAVVVASGGGALAAGTVLGLADLVAGTPAAGASNTAGTGTMGTVTLGGQAVVGTYRAVCTAKVAGHGTFAVYAPDGSRLADASGDVAYTSGHVNFTIAVTATDYEVGDLFTVAVSAAASPKAKAVDSTAVDGSQRPYAVLAEAVDATSADKTAPVYLSGEFNEDALAFGGTDTIATHRAALRALNIYAKGAVSA